MTTDSKKATMLREAAKKVLYYWSDHYEGGGALRKITYLKLQKKYPKKKMTTKLEGRGRE